MTKKIRGTARGGHTYLALVDMLPEAQRKRTGNALKWLEARVPADAFIRAPLSGSKAPKRGGGRTHVILVRADYAGFVKAYATLHGIRRSLIGTVPPVAAALEARYAA